MELPKIEKRKGISPLIATLLLIAIAVAASVLTYSWVMSMIGSQSNQAQTQLRIDSVSWNNGANTANVSIRNTGSVSATIESISIRTNTAGSSPVVDSFTTANAVDTGVVIYLVWNAGEVTASTSYVVRVTATTGFYYEAIFVSPSV